MVCIIMCAHVMHAWSQLYTTQIMHNQNLHSIPQFHASGNMDGLASAAGHVEVAPEAGSRKSHDQLNTMDSVHKMS